MICWRITSKSSFEGNHFLLRFCCSCTLSVYWTVCRMQNASAQSKLFEASKNGEILEVRQLLDQGANANDANEVHFTFSPLIWTALCVRLDFYNEYSILWISVKQNYVCGMAENFKTSPNYNNMNIEYNFLMQRISFTLPVLSPCFSCLSSPCHVIEWEHSPFYGSR